MATVVNAWNDREAGTMNARKDREVVAVYTLRGRVAAAENEWQERAAVVYAWQDWEAAVVHACGVASRGSWTAAESAPAFPMSRDRKMWWTKAKNIIPQSGDPVFMFAL